MIKYLELFIDTKAKRFSLFYLCSVILLFIFTTTMMISGYFLIFVQNEYQLQAVLTSDLFQWNYIVRLATLLLKTSQISLFNILMMLLQAIGILEWLMLIWFLLMEHRYLLKKRVMRFFLLFGMEAMICFGILLPLLNTQSFHEALTALHICGIIIVVFSFFQYLQIIVWIKKWFERYQNALQYQVIEVKSDEE